MSRGLKRSGGIPRSWAVLTGLVVLVVGAIFLLGRPSAPDYTLGGPLFPVDAAQIEGLLLTRQGMQYRFDRDAEGNWSLSGAISDYLDRQAMDALVKVLPTALGGAVLPGTSPEDRRYDFNGPEAMRLRVFVAGGRNISLALGARNPVTGSTYASGAGRESCFPVAGAFRDKVFMLPQTVQSRRVLPPFDRDKVQTLRLLRSGSEHVLSRHNGAWWLLLPSADLDTALRGFPTLVSDYQHLYTDRRREDALGVWLLANRRAVGQLIFEVSDSAVRDILDPRVAVSRRKQWQLDPPWRQVILQGEGLNPDPTAPVRDQFTVAFGTPVDKERVPAQRRGTVLITDLAAIKLLDQGLEVFVQQFALDEVARWADRLLVEREGHRLLQAGRTGESVTDEGREAWQTTFPGARQSQQSARSRDGLSQDLVVNLNRVAVLKVFPKTADPTVLQERERVRIVLSWDSAENPRELVLDIGFLDTDRLPAAVGAPARTEVGRPAVGLWFPASGKLLQIPDQLLVTARNIASSTGSNP